MGTAPPTGGDFSFELIRPPDRRSRFQSQLLHVTAERLVLAHQAFPSRPLVYGGQEVLATGYHAVWFLFKDCPFDVGRFYRPDGTWTGYYVDILEPVHWDGSDPHTLWPIVDLFLDLWITPAGGYAVLDEDEFQEAVAAGYLSPAQSSHAATVLRDLVDRVKDGTFPPDIVREFRF